MTEDHIIAYLFTAAAIACVIAWLILITRCSALP
jgi:hypothetical protein